MNIFKMYWSENIMKKIVSYIVSILILVSVLPLNAFAESAVVKSGTTGDCTWMLDGTVLTISGNGAMENYTASWMLPWSTNITKVVIESNVSNIGDYAFSNCTGLTSITISDSVTYIGWYAFDGCTGLTNVTIPDSVTHIRNGAFSDCTGLTNITIPGSVTNIDAFVFEGCTALQTIVVDEKNSVYHSEGNCIIHTKDKEVISGCKNSVIPSDGSVTSIGSFAFEFCTGLKKITIPDEITRIGYRAFSRCTGLTSIAIPNGVTDIDFDAFRACTGLTSITIPGSVTHIGDRAFSDCTGLTSITIPDSVTYIGSSAFRDTSPSLVIYTSENSAAYKYAKSNSIKLYLTKITRYISPPDLEKMQSNGNISVKITLKPTDNYEYKCNNGRWQKSNIFDNLSFDTDYTFYQRLGKTSENVASSPSDPKIIHTKKKNISVPVAPEIISKTAFSITLKEIDGYEYSIDGINWQKSNVFGGLKAIYEYTFFQRIAETEMFSASEISRGISARPLKLNNEVIPQKPQISSKTDTSITLKSITGYEYSIDNVNWQSDPVFKNLKPETEYRLYQRMAETDATYSSISSEFLIIKTYPERYCTDCLNTGVGADGKSCATCFGSGRFHIVGDADSDDEITDWDSVLCMRYLSGWNVEIPSKKCFDIDGDKRITDWDGVLFDRYLAGWNQETNIGAIVKGYPEHKHTYGNWIIESDPTCTVEGEKYRLCSICENDETVEIEKIPHNYEDWVTDKNATCTLKGEKHRICSTCGYEEISEIPKTAHNYGGWIIDKDSTCLVTGEKHHICSTCGYSENSVVWKKSHIVTYWIIDTPSTCAYEGSKHGECNNCGKTVSETINKLPHNMSVEIVGQQATCTTEGWGYRKCYYCGFEERYRISIKPHNYVNGYCTGCNKKE